MHLLSLQQCPACCRRGEGLDASKAMCRSRCVADGRAKCVSVLATDMPGHGVDTGSTWLRDCSRLLARRSVVVAYIASHKAQFLDVPHACRRIRHDPRDGSGHISRTWTGSFPVPISHSACQRWAGKTEPSASCMRAVGARIQGQTARTPFLSQAEFP